MNALFVAVLCFLAAGGTHAAALRKTGETGTICQPCTSNSACFQLTATAARKLQSQQMLRGGSAAAAMMCHGGQCVPEAAEKKDTFCDSLHSGAAALQELQSRVQEGLKGKAEVKQIAARRLLAGSPVVTDAFATTSAALNGVASFATDTNNGGGGDNGGGRGGDNDGGRGGDNGGGNGGGGDDGGGRGGWQPSPPGRWSPSPSPGRWSPSPPPKSPSPSPGHSTAPGPESPHYGGWGWYARNSPSPGRQSIDNVGGEQMNSWLQQSSFSDTANRPSLLQQQDDGAQSSYFHVPDDGAPKANVLAYGTGYVQLQGTTLRVIPHVQNLETCARHCDMDSQCTHWRRCAGGDCGSRLQECELMSGASNPATEAPAPSVVSRTVAPAVLQQLAPSVRYVDPAQSDIIMESGTKSPTEFPRSLYGCPYPAQPNGQVGACLPPPQCNCANGVCYGSC